MVYNIIKKDKTTSNVSQSKSSRPGKFFKSAILATGITLGTAFAMQGQDSINSQIKFQKSSYSYTSWDTLTSNFISFLQGKIEGKSLSTLKFVLRANIAIDGKPKKPLVIDDGRTKITLSIDEQKRLKQNKSVEKGNYYVIAGGDCTSLFVYQK